MARRPAPRSIRRRSRIATIPRWAWASAAIAALIAAWLLYRHLHERQEQPREFSNRALLLSRAQARLRADPNVADLVYSAPLDQWDATPAMPDADAKAFGHYLCFTLAEAGVTRPDTTVRVIDGAKLEANGFDYAAASRGTFGCGDDTR